MRIRMLILAMLGMGIAFLQPVAAEAPGTVVKHVDYKTQTITVELYRREQGTKVLTVYKINMGCTITLDGVTVELKKVHRGLHVTGMTEGNPGELDSLTLQN